MFENNCYILCLIVHLSGADFTALQVDTIVSVNYRYDQHICTALMFPCHLRTALGYGVKL